MLENKIGPEVDGNGERPRMIFTVSRPLTCELMTDGHHRGAWDA